MSVMEKAAEQIANREEIRIEWVSRLTSLVQSVGSWASKLGWTTRRIEKRPEDDEIGSHQVPALLLQNGTTRLILEPVGRTSGDISGVVDMYVMPAFDDAARLFFRHSGWHFDFVPASGSGFSGVEAPFTREAFRSLVVELAGHGD